MPMASVSSASEAASKPLSQNTSMARSSAWSRSNERGRPRGRRGREVSALFIVIDIKLLDTRPQVLLQWRFCNACYRNNLTVGRDFNNMKTASQGGNRRLVIVTATLTALA